MNIQYIQYISMNLQKKKTFKSNSNRIFTIILELNNITNFLITAKI